MKRILFIPAQIGLAHLLRCQAVAIELAERGYEPHILVETSKSKVLPNASNVHTQTFVAPRLTKPELIDDYTKKRFTRDEVRHYVNAYRELIETVDPAFIVVDTELFGLVAAHTSSRKYTFMANALMLPLRRGVAGEDAHKNPLVQMLKNGSGLITNVYIEGIISNLFKKYAKKTPSIPKLLSTVPVILPEWAEYVHLRKYFDTFNYVGPILNPLVELRDVAFEKQIKSQAKRKPIIYVSFGGTGFSKAKLQQIVAALIQKNYFVIVSTGTIAEPQDIQLEAEQGYVARYVPGLSSTALADCIITHCSQGTVVQAILVGTPIIGIPFNLDQMVHAFKVEEFGIGINAHKLGFVDLLKNMYNSKWLSDSATSIPLDHILDAVERVTNEDTYLKKLMSIQHRFGNHCNGAEKAANVIINALETNK